MPYYRLRRHRHHRINGPVANKPMSKSSLILFTLIGTVVLLLLMYLPHSFMISSSHRPNGAQGTAKLLRENHPRRV